MELVCSKENLAPGLIAVRNIANSRAVEHITQNVLIETDGSDTVKLSTTNLQMSITMRIPAKVANPGKACVSARILTEYVQSLPNDDIHIQWDELGAMDVQCEGKTARMACLPPDDFPPIPPIPETTIVTFPSEELRLLIKKVAFAAAKEEARPVLNGILFHIADSSYTFAAADGFRLAVQNGVLPAPVNEEFKTVIPASALKELERITAAQSDFIQIAIPFDGKRIAFISSNFVIQSQVIQGNFPNYEGLIPTSHTSRAVFPAKDLARAVKIAAIFAKAGESNIVRIESQYPTIDAPAPVAFVRTEAHPSGESNCQIPLQELDGSDIRIAFNTNYLQDLLNVLSGDVSLEMTQSSSPGVFMQQGDDDYIHVIMPMFVQWRDYVINENPDFVAAPEEEEIAEPVAA